MDLQWQRGIDHTPLRALSGAQIYGDSSSSSCTSPFGTSYRCTAHTGTLRRSPTPPHSAGSFESDIPPVVDDKRFREGVALTLQQPDYLGTPPASAGSSPVSTYSAQHVLLILGHLAIETADFAGFLASRSKSYFGHHPLHA